MSDTTTTPEPRFTLTLTETQLLAISKACEVVARLGIGQFSDALSCCFDANGDDIYSHDLERQISKIIKPLMGLHHSGSSWGVGKFKQVDRLFDIHEVIRNFWSWRRAIAEGVIKPGERRKWPEMMGTQYDEPMNWTKEPLPTIEEVKETGQ